MIVRKKDKFKNFIARKKLYRKANKLQKKMKKQEQIINFILKKLDEIDTPKGKEITIKK